MRRQIFFPAIVLAVLLTALPGLGAHFSKAYAEVKYAPKPNDIDRDLTKFGFNIVYAELFNMMMYPEKYEGKKICLTGKMAVFDNPIEGGKSYCCIVTDTPGCCSQGLEFVLKGAGEKSGANTDSASSINSSDYPPADSKITVCGIFKLNEKDGISYIRLIDSEFIR